MLRKAFTTFELIVVLTVIGILAAMALPRQQSTNLQEATDQIVKHMQLAQSLALAQDFYLSESAQSNDYTNLIKQSKSSVQWFKRWWQIQFHWAGSPQSSYSVYSDHPSDVPTTNMYNSFPDYSAVFSNGDILAVDAHSGLLIADINANINPQESRLTDVDIGAKYGVQIDMANCVSVSSNRNSDHILFDNLGRPHCAKPIGDVSLNPYDQLMTTQTRITLTLLNNNETRVICVEPESGYIHICG